MPGKQVKIYPAFYCINSLKTASKLKKITLFIIKIMSIIRYLLCLSLGGQKVCHIINIICMHDKINLKEHHTT